jgi:hypothetical protein
MPPLRHLSFLETAFDPRVAETFRELSQALDNVATQVGVSGTVTKAPPNIRSIAVTAANGYFNVVLTDPDGQAQPSLGIHYFCEWDTTPAFTNPQVIDNGPSRNLYHALGAQTLYWRAYSQYRYSPRSTAIVYGGSSPIGVVGGGGAGPAPAKSQGSGGRGGRGGFGG